MAQLADVLARGKRERQYGTDLSQTPSFRGRQGIGKRVMGGIGAGLKALSTPTRGVRAGGGGGGVPSKEAATAQGVVSFVGGILQAIENAKKAKVAQAFAQQKWELAVREKDNAAKESALRQMKMNQELYTSQVEFIKNVMEGKISTSREDMEEGDIGVINEDIHAMIDVIDKGGNSSALQGLKKMFPLIEESGKVDTSGEKAVADVAEMKEEERLASEPRPSPMGVVADGMLRPRAPSARRGGPLEDIDMSQFKLPKQRQRTAFPGIKTKSQVEAAKRGEETASSLGKGDALKALASDKEYVTAVGGIEAAKRKPEDPRDTQIKDLRIQTLQKGLKEKDLTPSNISSLLKSIEEARKFNSMSPDLFDLHPMDDMYDDLAGMLKKKIPTSKESKTTTTIKEPPKPKTGKITDEEFYGK